MPDVRPCSSMPVFIMQYNEMIHFLIRFQARYNVVPYGLLAWVSKRIEQDQPTFLRPWKIWILSVVKGLQNRPR